MEHERLNTEQKMGRDFIQYGKNGEYSKIYIWRDARKSENSSAGQKCSKSWEMGHEEERGPKLRSIKKGMVMIIR